MNFRQDPDGALTRREALKMFAIIFILIAGAYSKTPTLQMILAAGGLVMIIAALRY